MEKPVLFFSKNCPHSQTLWRHLSQNNLLDSFNKVSIDNNPNIPPAVQSVPTIYIRGRPLITGQSVMMFVNSLRQPASMGRQPPMQAQHPSIGQPLAQAQAQHPSMGQHPSIGQPQSQQGNRAMTIHNAPKDNTLQNMNERFEGINAYHPGEMSGNWSDSYSYLGASDAIGHSFEFLNDKGGYGRGDTTNPTVANSNPMGGGAGGRPLPAQLQAQPMGKRRGGSDLDARYAAMMESRDPAGGRR